MKKCILIFSLILVLLLASCTGAGSRKPLCPEKAEMTAEDKALADRCYDLLKKHYPRFAAIPRELLLEQVYVYESDSKDVSFTFCIGGCETEYKCIYSFGPEDPEGSWIMFGEEFAGFEKCFLTEEETASLKTMLLNSTSAFIEENHLDGSRLDPDEINFNWTLNNGKLCAVSETIADVTDETTASFGCIDHAHVSSSVLVEYNGGGVTLTDLGVRGS